MVETIFCNNTKSNDNRCDINLFSITDYHYSFINITHFNIFMCISNNNLIKNWKLIKVYCFMHGWRSLTISSLFLLFGGACLFGTVDFVTILLCFSRCTSCARWFTFALNISYFFLLKKTSFFIYLNKTEWRS